MLSDVIRRLQKAGCLIEQLAKKETREVVEELASHVDMRDAQVMSVIEFGRCVHAEMAAIVDAARRGAAVDGATLFSTTFPCHECARHIVAAGIRRVVYVEPYPKSLVNELYPDSIQVDADSHSGTHVDFEPFVGVAPRRYLDLFSLGEMDRKDKMGRIQEWDRAIAMPRLGEYSFRTELINGLTELKDFDGFARELFTLGFVEKVVDE
jgi:cytidine deaminase